jgi:tetratricopeptide (TPR) repeat protein
MDAALTVILGVAFSSGLVVVMATPRLRLVAITSAGLKALRRGDYVEAQSCFERSRGLAERLFGEEHWRVALQSNNVGVALTCQGRAADAAPHVDRALAIVNPLAHLPHRDVAVVWVGAALQRAAVKDHDATIALATKAIQSGRLKRAQEDTARLALGVAYLEKEDPERAIVVFEGRQLPVAARPLAMRAAQMFFAAGNAERAITATDLLLATNAKQEAPQTLAIIRTLRAFALLAAGRAKEARDDAVRAVDDLEKVVPGQMVLVEPLLLVARASAKTGDRASMVSACERVIALTSPSEDNEHPYRAKPSDDARSRAADEARALLASMNEARHGA